MIRATLNTYLDGLLSLAQDKGATGRILLVEEALANQSVRHLVQDWLWINNKDITSALKLRTWFSLSYEELADIFGIGFREMSQVIRNQRVQLLPPYRPETTAIPYGSELSCFMVDQQLSAWMDSELEDGRSISQIHLHLSACPLCRGRLELYRSLHAEILSQRESFVSISEEEWMRAIRWLKRTWKKRVIKAIAVSIIVLGGALILSWVLWSKPEKMPNIYEIESE